MFESNKKKYNLGIDDAGKMLENVFAACDTTPNEVPFDKIVLQSRQNFFTDNLLIIISTVIILITFFAPLFFPHSKAFVSVDPSKARPLQVVGSSLTDDTFSISFAGNTLDVGNSYMVSEFDEIVNPVSYDRDTNTITFPIILIEYNIYVYDIDGGCMHLLFTPHD